MGFALNGGVNVFGRFVSICGWGESSGFRQRRFVVADFHVARFQDILGFGNGCEQFFGAELTEQFGLLVAQIADLADFIANPIE